jgi:hypothetical protein
MDINVEILLSSASNVPAKAMGRDWDPSGIP